MSSKFNLDIIGEIADKNLDMNKTQNEIKLIDIVSMEQATTFIKLNDNNITNSWFNMSHALKKVRDEKLYKIPEQIIIVFNFREINLIFM